MSAAFPVADPPSELVSGETPDHLAVRAKLAGKRWTEVSGEFLEKRHFWLTPEAWAYFLPARLTAGLGSDEAAWRLAVSVNPDMLRVLHGGDRLLERQLAPLDGVRYRAATDALWSLMDTGTQTGRWIARALHYGWSSRPSPALDAARAYRAGLDGNPWPRHEDPDVDALLLLLAEAFAAAPYPGDGLIIDDPEHCWECAGCELELRGRHWRTMHPDVIKVADEALSFASPAGFRFFLPAWIAADLNGEGWNADPVFHVSYGLVDGEEAARERSLYRFAEFSPGERKAVGEYLRLRRERDAHDAGRIGQALARFWARSA